MDDTTGKHRVVVSQGANAYATQAGIPDDLLTKDTVLLLQAELKLEETAKLMQRARARTCKSVILNLAPPKGLTAEMMSNIDILVMNEHEAVALGKHLGLPEQPFEDMAKTFNKLYGVTPMITLGEHGALAFDGTATHRVPALKIKAVDTLGAGDAFCGMLAACVDRGMPLPEAMRYASIAARSPARKRAPRAPCRLWMT